MIKLFITTLFITFFITRFGAILLHDHEGYKNKQERSKTLTGIIRRKTGIDFHHIHLGAIILFMLFPFIVIYGINTINLIISAIGISLFIDQIVPYTFRKIKYFSIKDFFISLFLHIILALIIVFFL
ncbi:MAG: hypothetical protein QXI33_02930 [Candidatus Pacearchaeota archaeon]